MRKSAMWKIMDEIDEFWTKYRYYNLESWYFYVMLIPKKFYFCIFPVDFEETYPVKKPLFLKCFLALFPSFFNQKTYQKQRFFQKKKTDKKSILPKTKSNMQIKIFLVMWNTNPHPERRGIVKIWSTES